MLPLSAASLVYYIPVADTLMLLHCVRCAQAKLALDVEGVAARLVALKAAWPGADLSALLTQFPKALMFTPEEIAVEGAKVR